MRNIEVLKLHHDLIHLKGVSGIKLVYAIHRTIAWLKPIAEAFSQEKLIPMPEAYAKYQKEIHDFYKKVTTNQDGSLRTIMLPGPDGKPVESFDLPFEDPEFLAEKSRIEQKHEKAILEYKKEIEDYNQFLNKECDEEIRIFFIPVAYAPENKDQFDVVAPLIREMTPDQEAKWEELFTEMLSV